MKHLIIIMSFMVLMSYGYGKAGAWQSQASKVDAFYERILSEAKPVNLWKRPTKLQTQQAAVLSAVYGVNDNNVDSYKEWW